MGRTSSAAKNRYNAKAYDRLTIVVPKGQKPQIEAYAKAQGKSVNRLVHDLLEKEMGEALQPPAPVSEE